MIWYEDDKENVSRKFSTKDNKMTTVYIKFYNEDGTDLIGEIYLYGDCFEDYMSRFCYGY